MRTKIALAALSLLTTVVAVSSAGAGIERTTGEARVDLSSRAAINDYLRTIGVDPATVVVQRGARNYAGSRCPGKAWNCTKAKRVVQVATTAKGKNKVDCTPATTSGPDSCVIVQSASGGVNDGKCRFDRKEEKESSVTQSCTITQTNTTGANNARTDQDLELNADSVTGVQSATVTQTNGTGANSVKVSQKLVEDASAGHKEVTQSQTGDLSYDISQTSASGTNTATASQTLKQEAKAPAAVTGTQTQNGNLEGDLDQSSSGISTMTSTQDETQTARFKKGGAVTVTQNGPEDCCSGQGTNPADTFQIIQRSTQTAPGTTQTQQQNAHYTSTGNGTAEQSSTQNGETSTNTASGSSVNITQGCTNGDCVQETGFAPGDVFVSIGNGDVEWRDAGGNLKETLHTGESGFTTGLDFDAAGNLYVTDFSANKVSKFDQFGDFASSFSTGGTAPESIVFDAANNAYVGHADGDADVRKFTASGTPLGSFDVATEDRGSDWIELAPDQCTLFYTSEGLDIFRYNVCTSTQLTKFVDESGDESEEGIDRKYALQLLPDGGVLVAATSEIIRYSAIGDVVQTYDAPGEQLWFSLGLAGPGAFWAGDPISGFVAKFDLATDAVLDSFTTASTQEGGKAGGIVVR